MTKTTTEPKVFPTVSGTPEFLKACSEADVKPTTRQWKKWNKQYGAAYKTSKGIPVQPSKAE